jgi:hypothetical protein
MLLRGSFVTSVLTFSFDIRMDELMLPRASPVTCRARTGTPVKTYDNRKMTRFRRVADGRRSPNASKRHVKSDRAYIYPTPVSSQGKTVGWVDTPRPPSCHAAAPSAGAKWSLANFFVGQDLQTKASLLVCACAIAWRRLQLSTRRAERTAGSPHATLQPWPRCGEPFGARSSEHDQVASRVETTRKTFVETVWPVW